MNNLNLINTLKKVILETEPESKSGTTLSQPNIKTKRGGFFKRFKEKKQQRIAAAKLPRTPEQILKDLKDRYDGTYILKETSSTYIQNKNGIFVTTKSDPSAYQIEIQLISLNEMMIKRLFFSPHTYKLNYTHNDYTILNVGTTGSAIPKNNELVSYGVSDGEKGDYAGGFVVFAKGNLDSITLKTYAGDYCEIQECRLTKISDTLTDDLANVLPINGGSDVQKKFDDASKAALERQAKDYIDGNTVFRDDTCRPQWDTKNNCYYQPAINSRTNERCVREENNVRPIVGISTSIEKRYNFCDSKLFFNVKGLDGKIVKKNMKDEIQQIASSDSSVETPKSDGTVTN